MSLKTYQVLLIDDDEDDFIHIRELLNEIPSHPYKVSWKANYQDGLKALQETVFDACLLDYKLGEKTGLELLDEAIAIGAQCPIIFLTGLGDIELDMKAMESGASDYLVKDQLTSPLLERTIRYAIKTAQDFGEMKEIKAQVLQQDRLASLGLIASSLAHEIGTPLGIIRSRAELAGKRAQGQTALKSDMDVVVTQIDRITKLVQSLLHLARGHKSDFVTIVSLDRVLDDVLNLLEHEFLRKNICLKKELQADLRLKAESGPLGQVLLNILINAIHAIEQARLQGNQDPHEVILKAERQNRDIVISVRDTGVGISDFHKKNLFKPFFTTKDVGQGTGLGLATSLRIVSSWNGTILVESELGKGSTFIIQIPGAE